MKLTQTLTHRKSAALLLYSELNKVERSKYVNNLYDNGTTVCRYKEDGKAVGRIIVPFLHYCSVSYHCSVFALLFRSVFVTLFRFLHKEQKLNSMVLYNCSVFSHGTTEQFRYCTTVPFLHFCSVFIPLSIFFSHKEQRNKNGTVWYCITVPFFFSYETTEQFRFCTTVPFLHYSSVFIPLFRFCITVPFL